MSLILILLVCDVEGGGAKRPDTGPFAVNEFHTVPTPRARPERECIAPTMHSASAHTRHRDGRHTQHDSCNDSMHRATGDAHGAHEAWNGRSHTHEPEPRTSRRAGVQPTPLKLKAAFSFTYTLHTIMAATGRRRCCYRWRDRSLSARLHTQHRDAPRTAHRHRALPHGAAHLSMHAAGAGAGGVEESSPYARRSTHQHEAVRLRALLLVTPRIAPVSHPTPARPLAAHSTARQPSSPLLSSPLLSSFLMHRAPMWYGVDRSLPTTRHTMHLSITLGHTRTRARGSFGLGVGRVGWCALHRPCHFGVRMPRPWPTGKRLATRGCGGGVRMPPPS
jgi:hypothetical protein